MVHGYNPSPWETKTGLRVQDQLGVHDETLSQTRKEKVGSLFLPDPTLSHQDALGRTQHTDEQNKTKGHKQTPPLQTTDFQHRCRVHLVRTEMFVRLNPQSPDKSELRMS